MKKIVLIFVALFIILTAYSCSGEKTDVNITVLAGPSGMGAVKIMQDNEDKKTKNNYNFTVATAPDEVSAAIISGDTDIAAVPSNLASVLYNKTNGEVTVLTASTKGVLYLLDTTGTINSVSDLKGKKIYATGQGSTPEYILNYILENNGLKVGVEVEIEYLTAHAELASMLVSGNSDVQIAMLPEPNVSVVTSAKPEIKIALNLTEEWDKITAENGSVLQGVVVVRNKFLESNPESVNKFMDEYKKSVDYVNSNNNEAADLISKYGILEKADTALKALPNCNITYIDGSELKKQLGGFLSELFKANPASVGGKLPEDNFYYSK